MDKKGFTLVAVIIAILGALLALGLGIGAHYFTEQKKTSVLQELPTDMKELGKFLSAKVENQQSLHFVLKKIVGSVGKEPFNFIAEGDALKPDKAKGIFNENYNDINDKNSLLYEQFIIDGNQSFSKSLSAHASSNNVMRVEGENKWLENGPLLFWGPQEWYATPPNLYLLLKYAKSGVKLNDGTIDGISYNHFKFDIDTNEANKSLTGGSVDPEDKPGSPGTALANTLSAEVWFTKDDRLIYKIQVVKNETDGNA